MLRGRILRNSLRHSGVGTFWYGRSSVGGSSIAAGYQVGRCMVISTTTVLQARILTRMTGSPRCSVHLGGYKPPRSHALAFTVVTQSGRPTANTAATTLLPPALSRTAMGGALLPPHRLRQRHASHQASTSWRRRRRPGQHSEQRLPQNEPARAADHGSDHHQRDDLLPGRVSPCEVVR